MYKIEIHNLVEDFFENISTFDLDHYPEQEEAASYVDADTASKYSNIVIQVYCYETGSPELFYEFNYNY
jgi:hypothetical protein